MIVPCYTDTHTWVGAMMIPIHVDDQRSIVIVPHKNVYIYKAKK